MDFQTRAKLADSAVWAALLNQIGTLTDPADLEAVLVGATTALTRAFYAVSEPGGVVAQMTAMAEKAAGEMKRLEEDSAP